MVVWVPACLTSSDLLGGSSAVLCKRCAVLLARVVPVLLLPGSLCYI